MAKSFLVFVFLNFFIYFASTFPIGNVTEVCIELARKISNDSTVLYQCEPWENVLMCPLKSGLVGLTRC